MHIENPWSFVDAQVRIVGIQIGRQNRLTDAERVPGEARASEILIDSASSPCDAFRECIARQEIHGTRARLQFHLHGVIAAVSPRRVDRHAAMLGMRAAALNVPYADSR